MYCKKIVKFKIDNFYCKFTLRLKEIFFFVKIIFLKSSAFFLLIIDSKLKLLLGPIIFVCYV